MIIRSANQNDVQQLTSIKRPTEEHRTRFAEIHANRLAQAVQGKAVYFVAEDAGEIVGHVFLKFYGSETEPDCPNIEDLYVREDRRGSGIGSALLSRCEALLREKGYGRVGLSVNPELNPRAKALYERLGYINVSRAPYLGGVYDGDEDWVIDMVKLL